MANGAHSRQDPAKGAGVLALEREAHGLADRLPEILIDAQRIAQTVAHGLHGRRRAGPGETFWQFRQFQASDTLRQIDWRRSASSDHLYVREREWEAAHTVWLWPDLSESMNFRSHLAPSTKRDRAVLLMLAAAELLVRGGERVAMLGLTQPTASRKATTRMAEAILAHQSAESVGATQPPKVQLARFSGAVLFSDFLDPIAKTREHIEALGRRWRRRPPHRDRRSGGRDAALRRAHRVPEPRRRPTLGRRPRAKPARAIQGTARGPPRRAARADASASAGRSSSITPTARRPSRC